MENTTFNKKMKDSSFSRVFPLKIKPFLIKFAFFALNGAFSVFLYANVMEKALFIDLPYLDSVQKSVLPNKINFLDGEQPIYPKDFFEKSKLDKMQGLYGKPMVLRFPSLGLTYSIQEAIEKGNGYIVSNSKVYYKIIDESSSGLLGDTVIFSSPNFRQFDALSLLVEGDRFIVTTDKNWTYTLKIEKKFLLTDKQNYLLTDIPTSSIILMKEFSIGTLIIDGKFLSVSEALQ